MGCPSSTILLWLGVGRHVRTAVGSHPNSTTERQLYAGTSTRFPSKSLPKLLQRSRDDHKRLDLIASTGFSNSSLSPFFQKTARTANMNMIDDEAKSTESSDSVWSSSSSDSTGSLRDFVVADDEVLSEDPQTPPPR